MLATTVHLAVLNGAQTVDGLVLIQCKRLVEWGKGVRFLAQQHFPLGGHKSEAACFLVQLHFQLGTLGGVAVLGERHLLGLGDNHLALGCYRLSRILHHVDNRGGEELDFYTLCAQCEGRQQGHQYCYDSTFHDYWIL